MSNNKYFSFIVLYTRVIIVLTLCTLSGFILNYFNFPASWVLGSTIASLFCSLSNRISVSPSMKLRTFSGTIIGLSLANAIHIQLSNNTDINFFSEKWIAGLSLMFIMVFIVLIINYKNYRKHGFDVTTSLLSVLPGGLSSTLLLADSFPSNKQVITISQVTRYIFIIVLFSLLFVFETTTTKVSNNTDLVLHPLLPQLCFIFTIFIIILVIRKFINITPLIFAIITGIILYQTNIVDIHLDSLVKTFAQILLGWLAGSQLNLLNRKTTTKLIVLALKSSIVASIISIVISIIGYKFFNLDLQSLVLALAPGGADSMSFLSLNLGLDILFVSFNQIIRIVSLDALVMIVTSLSNFKKPKANIKS